MNLRFGRWVCGLVWAGLWLGAVAVRADDPPKIQHEPITTAIRSQPITITARVRDDSGLVKYVTLFYSLSRDAAPFRISMKLSGDDLYVGTIPPDLLGSVDKVFYYLEAMDQEERAQETPWYTVDIKDVVAPKPKVAEKTTAPAPVAPTTPTPARREGASLLGIGVIAGGAAAVLGGALLIADQDKDSGSDDGPEQYAGNYAGEVVECTAPQGQNASCSTRSMSVVVERSGEVTTSNLRQGALLTGTMNRNKFLLVAEWTSSWSGETGQVFYEGNILDDRLYGTITGHATNDAGEVIYSGNFSGTKR